MEKAKSMFVVDGAAMPRLEKQYPLWKSKVKAKPKNKCPW
jgi:hypothetical protein